MPTWLMAIGVIGFALVAIANVFWQILIFWDYEVNQEMQWKPLLVSFGIDLALLGVVLFGAYFS